MARHLSPYSIFSQRLDRAVFGTYFLGGVMPLAALAVVVSHWVLPQAQAELERWAWIAGLVSLGLMSLALYFALRFITARAIHRMDADNQRLQILLETSRELSELSHPEASLAAIADRVRQFDQITSSALFFSSAVDKELELHGATDEAGRQWVEESASLFQALNEEALACGTPVLGENETIVVPFQRPNGMRGTLAIAGEGALSADTVDAVATVAGIAANAIERGDLEDAQRNFFAHVTDLLVSALDAHVVNREGHAMHTARLCSSIGHELGLEGKQKELLHWGAILHDIGMLKIEREKHRDRKVVQAHSMISARMLERIRLWKPVAPIVLHHHEWFDGTGYPEGLAGEDIPLQSRVIALADAVDAMRRDDATSPGMSLTEICEEIARGSGTQFDPQVVAIFLKLVERDEVKL